MELPATHFANPWVESDTICFVHSGGAKQDRFDSTGNALISTRWHNPGVLLWQNKSVSLSIEHQKFIWAHSGQFNEIPFGFDDRVILWAAIQGNKIFVCPRALVNHKNLPFWLFQQDQGFVLKGEIPVRLQLKPEEMPDLPEGMVFTPDAIYGLASNLDGFWITERPFKPGPFQYVHAVDLNGNVQTFEIKVNTDVPLQDVMVKFGDKWVGFDTVTESFYVFTL
ncbi:MAG: hypothetical protein H6510_02075 [Acidobacteria bacterium]|nr:hypothetical protein [Acidobacteriota bacterium]